MTSALSELDSLLASFSGSAAPSGQDLNQLLSNLDLNYGPTSSPPTSIPAATAATPAPTTGPAATAATDILECQIKTPQKPKTNLKSAAGKLSEGIDQMVASLTYPASKAEAGSASMPGVSSVGYGQEPSAQAGLGGYAMPVGERVSHASAPAPGHQNVQYAPGPAGVAHMYAGLPVCKYCSKAIPGECILAMNSYYHPHHFVCANCEKPLEVSNFYALHELPHCASCYAALSSSLCARCLQPCRPGEGIQALGKHWHPEHFTCSQCTAQLTSRFFNKNGQPHCETCATYSSDVCGACNQPIRGGGVSALGRKWHPEHLVCSVCRAPAFHSGMVYERGGNVYCKTHYDASSHLPKCQSCSGEISLSQTPVVIGAKSWHPEHFKCNFCWASLTPDSFRISSAQDPYCSPCFDKLF